MSAGMKGETVWRSPKPTTPVEGVVAHPKLGSHRYLDLGISQRIHITLPQTKFQLLGFENLRRFSQEHTGEMPRGIQM